MTLPLPAYDGTPETLQFILDLIAQAFVDTGGHQIRMRSGSVSMNFAGVADSDITTITHGLGTTPTAIFCMPTLPSDLVADAVVVNQYQAATSTIFKVRGHVASGVAIGPGTITCYWLAIG